MNIYIHKIFVPLVMILAICSCSEDVGDLDSADSQCDVPIVFSAQVAATKGSELTETAFLTEGQTFPIYVYSNDGSEYFNTTVTRNESDWSYTTSEDIEDEYYYWPEDRTSLTFYAYNLPVSGEAGTSISSNDDGDKYISYVSYYDVSYQEDLIVAEAKYTPTSSVELEFEHALSKINFTLTFDTEEPNIRDVKLYYTYENLYTHGDYYFSATGGEWQNLNKDYVNSAELGPLTLYDLDTSNKTHIYDEDFFLIPQTIDEYSYLLVRVEYSLFNDEDLNYTVTTGNLPLYSSDLTKWEKGIEYLYNLTIDTSNELSMSLEVADREETVAQGNIDLQYLSSVEDTEARISTLINDEVAPVLDFVVYGKYSDNAGVFGDSYQNNPFITAFGDTCTLSDDDGDNVNTVTYVSSTNSNLIDKLISVDLRAITGLPTFAEMHGGVPDADSADNNLTGNEPSLPSQMFEHVQRLEEVMMPEEIVAIGDLAFQGCVNLKTVYLENVQHVESNAFQGCYKLESAIGDKLTRIHVNGFDNCWALKTIDLANVTQIDDFGFVECSSLEEVDLSNVTIVGEFAFDGCVNMHVKSGTHIPNLTVINKYAFAKCEKLGTYEPVTISAAETIGEHAFNGCLELNFPTYEVGDDGVGGYNMPNIYSIGDKAFASCSNIVDIGISNVTEVGYSAFYECSNMQLNGTDLSFDNLTTIAAEAFQGCTNLCAKNKISIVPSQIETIGYSAFYNADLRLSNEGVLDFENLTVLGYQAFQNCTNLDSSFKFSNESITTLPYACFSNCYKLTGLSLDHVNYLDGYALNGCRGLTSLLIGGENCSVGEDPVFDDMPYSNECALTLNKDQDEYVTNQNMWNSKEWKSITFTDASAPTDDNIMHVEYSSYWAYGVDYDDADLDVWAANKAANDARFTARLEYLLTQSTEIEVVGDFADCSFSFANSNVTKYDFSALTNANGALTMQNCSSLEEVVIPDYITSFSDYAFSTCSALTTLDLSNITTLGSQMFNGCGVTSLALPKLTTMNDYTFAWCNITTLDLSGTGDIYITGTAENPFYEHSVGDCDLIISADTKFYYNDVEISISDIEWKSITYSPSES